MGSAVAPRFPTGQDLQDTLAHGGWNLRLLQGLPHLADHDRIDRFVRPAEIQRRIYHEVMMFGVNHCTPAHAR